MAHRLRGIYYERKFKQKRLPILSSKQLVAHRFRDSFYVRRVEQNTEQQSLDKIPSLDTWSLPLF